MINDVPILIDVLFVLTVGSVAGLCYWAVQQALFDGIKKKAASILAGIVCWLTLQGALTIAKVYNSDYQSLPPNIVTFGILPTAVVTLLLFFTRSGRQLIQQLPLQQLTYLHVIRIPVEVVLYFLSLYKVVPEIMTFAGRNFDIIAGVSAPVVGYLAFVKKRTPNAKMLIFWNLICLGLLLNIVVIAFFSAPTPFQKFGFNQPNVAILNFPFSWLPTFIVPVVLVSHLASLYQLLKNKGAINRATKQ